MEKHELQRRAEMVAEEYGGVLPTSFAFYERSILYCAECAARDLTHYFGALEQEAEHSVIFGHLQAALSQAASLSNFFFPLISRGNKLADARRKSLRVQFEVEDSSNLSQRNLRNSLLHFDERLDEFLLEMDAGYFMPDPIVGSVELAASPVHHIFKLADPRAGLAVILGKQYEYEGIFEDVFSVGEKARTLA